MRITEEMIEAAREKGACEDALEWLTAAPRTVGELCDEYPSWALWAVGHDCLEFLPERLDSCAEREPWAALCYAAARLSSERLDRCAEREPRAALGYAAALLTSARLDSCAERVPGAALRYAAALLTPARLDSCAERDPWSALGYAAALLTPERLAACKRATGR